MYYTAKFNQKVHQKYFLNIKYSRGCPHCRLLLKEREKTIQTYLAGAGLKRPKEKQNITKQEALHKEEKWLVWPHQEIYVPKV